MTISKKRTRTISLIVISVLILGTIGAFTAYSLFIEPINNELTTKSIYIDSDDTIDSLYLKIEEQIGSPTPKGFKLISKYKQLEKQIKTGHYQIDNTDNSYTLFIKFSRGHQKPVKLIINNLRTLEQLASQIDDQLMLDSVSLITYLHNEENMAKLGYTKETLPALFIPNTYEVYWNMSITDFIQRMEREHKLFWNDERTKKADLIGFTPIEIATIASIVEEETNAKSEQPTVAGLYINRLKRGMLLQADPTIKFAHQDFAMKRILNKDLEIDSPYNTYKNTGLPPGPIRFASISGLNSVLNYEEHNYLYMCAKEDFSGLHNFATNLSEHMRNARKYWQALNRLKIYN